jgi:hypothetical protein
MKPDPIADAVARELALVSSHAVTGDTDPSNNYKVGPPPRCVGCGKAHGPVTEAFTCLRTHLAAARLRVKELEGELRERPATTHPALLPEAIERNRAQSDAFDRTRGTLKR